MEEELTAAVKKIVTKVTVNVFARTLHYSCKCYWENRNETGNRSSCLRLSCLMMLWHQNMLLGAVLHTQELAPSYEYTEDEMLKNKFSGCYVRGQCLIFTLPLLSNYRISEKTPAWISWSSYTYHGAFLFCRSFEIITVITFHFSNWANSSDLYTKIFQCIIIENIRN
jgi:hypothetical protein